MHTVGETDASRSIEARTNHQGTRESSVSKEIVVNVKRVVVVDFQQQQRRKDEVNAAEVGPCAVVEHMPASSMNTCRQRWRKRQPTYPSYACDLEHSSIPGGQ